MASESRGANIGAWIASGLCALAFLGSGSMKLFLDPAAAAQAFEHFGYGAGLAKFIGVCELAGAIGLLIPRLSGLAAIGLMIIMAGAVYSHLSVDPVANAVPAFVLLCLLGFVLYVRRLPFGGSA